MRAARRASRLVEVVNLGGLHARPAAELVKLAEEFSSRVTLATEEGSADARSILDVLALAVERGSALKVSATGRDAEQAVDAITALVSRGFSEGG